MFYFSYYIPSTLFVIDEQGQSEEDVLLGLDKERRNIKIITVVITFLYIFYTYIIQNLEFWSFLSKKFSIWTASSGFFLYSNNIYDFTEFSYLLDMYANSVIPTYMTVSTTLPIFFVWLYKTDFFQSFIQLIDSFEEYLRVSSGLFPQFVEFFDLFDISLLKYWLLFLVAWFLFFIWIWKVTKQLFKEDTSDAYISEGSPNQVFFERSTRSRKIHAAVFSYYYTLQTRIKASKSFFKVSDISEFTEVEYFWLYSQYGTHAERNSGLMLSSWICIPIWGIFFLAFLESNIFLDNEYSFNLVEVIGDREEWFRFDFWGITYIYDILLPSEEDSFNTTALDMKNLVSTIYSNKDNANMEWNSLEYDFLSNKESRNLYTFTTFQKLLYNFLEVYFSFVSSYITDSSIFKNFFLGGSFWENLVLDGFGVVENIFWWNSPQTNYYLRLSMPGGWWPGLWYASFAQDYFNVWAPILYTWDVSWIFLNKVFVSLDTSNYNNTFFSSYWSKWVAIHTEWSSYLIADLDVKFNLGDYSKDRLPLSTNKAIAINIIQQYEIMQLLTSNFLMYKNKLSDSDKVLVDARLSFATMPSMPYKGGGADPVKEMQDLVTLETKQVKNAFEKQKKILEQASRGNNYKWNWRVPEFWWRAELDITKNYSSVSAFKNYSHPWAQWEFYLNSKLRYYKVNKGYSGTYYYNNQFISKFDDTNSFSPVPWKEKLYKIHDSNNFFINFLNFYIFCLTGSERFLIPEQIYYYKLNFGNWWKEIVKYVQFYKVMFSINSNIHYKLESQPGDNSLGYLLNLDSKFVADFVDTTNFASTFLSDNLKSFYVKSYLKRNMLFPQLNNDVFNVQNFFKKDNLLKDVAHFMTDESYGWSNKSVLKKNTYQNIFYGSGVDPVPPTASEDALMSGVERVSPTFGLDSIKESFLNFYNVGKSPVKVFLSQLLLDRYQLIFGRGLGAYYFFLPGWWKTRWFNYFLTYYSLEYKLLLTKNIDLNYNRMPDYYLKISGSSSSKNQSLSARFVDVEFNKFLTLLEDIDIPLFESSLYNNSLNSFFLKNNDKGLVMGLNKIFYFGFLNYPSNFYLYTMYDLLKGRYEDFLIKSDLNPSKLASTHQKYFDFLSADLGIYLGYYGFLRNSVYSVNDHTLSYQYYKKQEDYFLWQKLVLSPWESFVFRLYGFYKNQIGLSYYYSNLSQDINNLVLGIGDLPPTIQSIWSPNSTLVNYLHHFKSFKYYSELHVNGTSDFFMDQKSLVNSSALKLRGVCNSNAHLGGGIPIFTQATVEDFFQVAYNYKSLVLFEKSNLVARELYYWGNSWYSKNFGGIADSKLDFLGLDSFSYQLKYNKISKLYSTSLGSEIFN